MGAYRIEKFTDKRGERRVRIIAPNNKNTYSSQGYKNDKDLEETMYNNMVSLIEYFRLKGEACNNIDCTFTQVKGDEA